MRDCNGLAEEGGCSALNDGLFKGISREMTYGGAAGGSGSGSGGSGSGCLVSGFLLLLLRRSYREAEFIRKLTPLLSLALSCVFEQVLTYEDDVGGCGSARGAHPWPSPISARIITLHSVNLDTGELHACNCN